MLELNQFRQSSFCLKVRMVLEAKSLNYRVIEINPIIGQVSIFRLSGQKQVPVLVDGDNVIVDSSAIIRHLEKLHPNPQLIPKDPKEAALVHLIEDWADTTMAKSARTALIQSAAADKSLFAALLPEELPISIKNALKGVSTKNVLSQIYEFINKGSGSDLLSSLKELSNLITNNNWLVGDSMSFADIAVAAQLSLLKFPKSAGSELEGKGCLGFKDHPELAPLFAWRDQLEAALHQPDVLKKSKITENDSY